MADRSGGSSGQATRSGQIDGRGREWPDGRPASGAWVALWDADKTSRQVAVGIRAESDGQFRSTTYEGLAYVAMAHAEIPGDARRRQGSIRTPPFVARADMPALRLVLAVPPEQ